MAGVYGEPLTEAEIEEVIKLSDVDGDGQIVRCSFLVWHTDSPQNYNEFVTLVLSKVS